MSARLRAGPSAAKQLRRTVACVIQASSFGTTTDHLLLPCLRTSPSLFSFLSFHPSPAKEQPCSWSTLPAGGDITLSFSWGNNRTGGSDPRDTVPVPSSRQLLRLMSWKSGPCLATRPWATALFRATLSCWWNRPDPIEPLLDKMGVRTTNSTAAAAASTATSTSSSRAATTFGLGQSQTPWVFRVLQPGILTSATEQVSQPKEQSRLITFMPITRRSPTNPAEV
ncbi:hypothetical protein EYF80_013407 [Liparis tanakae]|uniref:Uncharacterized protein n=1 Tax=Liparis tanakae TaxID=230148 RepID=A0A4Z2IE88_9TELE|nr:hypothetical protein EYF80_013407 [Liparis tanakae]